MTSHYRFHDQLTHAANAKFNQSDPNIWTTTRASILSQLSVALLPPSVCRQWTHSSRSVCSRSMPSGSVPAPALA